MNRTTRLIAAALVTFGAVGAASAAHAATNVQFSIGLPVYAQPAPVYAEPAPVYVQPQAVYGEPVYAAPAQVYVRRGPPASDYAYEREREHERAWRHEEWRRHHWAREHGWGRRGWD